MIFRYQLLTLLGVLFISLSFGCEKSAPVSSGNANVSLIVATMNDSGYPRPEHLMRYDFANGELVSNETVLSHPAGNPDFPRSRFYKDRYVISDWGTIADIETGELIYSGGCDVRNAIIKGMDGEVLVIYSEDTDEYYSYDLEKRECSLLTEPTRWALPGFISPDGNRSITVEYAPNLWGCNEILLHTLDGNITSLGANFCEQLSMASSRFPAVPVMWLDNQSFITQVSNGEIVTVKIDGTIEPVVKMNLSREIHPTTLQLGLLGASFFTYSSGTIVYELWYAYYPAQEPGANVKWFMIDTENKSYSLYNPDWIDMGHGFEAASVIDDNHNRAVRYNGSYIGQACFSERYAKTTEGHIALLHHDTADTGPEAVKVWSRVNQEWTTIEYESHLRVDYGGIIGWIK